MDDYKKPTKFTLWEDFIDHDGNKLLELLKIEYPIILAKKVARPKSSSGLTNKFSTRIEINPPYPQANALRTAQQNEQMLITYTMKSTGPTGSLLFVPFE
ncbi:replication protein A 70 kDa DNA-binding subunit A-like isoform X2 [Nicotiana tabacum]|uniref:Replication protein A 70 kDa DNA-binding subunit A-like isoform X2 n=1 Tax=Nicotiana tabacum TaxID=4097 RepID=A0AC58UM24_TOBAC